MDIQSSHTINLSHDETVAALLEGLQKKHKGKVIPKDADLSKIGVSFDAEFSNPDTATGKLRRCEITLPPVTQVVTPESAEGQSS